MCDNAPPLEAAAPVLPLLILILLCVMTLPLNAFKLALYCIALLPCFIVCSVYAVRACERWKEEK